MTTQTEALKMALEVMRNQGDVSVDEWIATENAIKEALAQQSNEQVEPRAYLVYAKGSHRYFTLTFDIEKVPEIYKGGDVEPLYTHLPVPTAQPKEPEQEPVAWKPDRSGKYFTAVYRDLIPGDEVGAIVDHPKCVIMSWSNAVHDVEQLSNTTQPQRKLWVSLNDEQIDDCRYFCPTPLPQSTASDYVDWHKKTHVRAFARNVESKLRELNEATQPKPLTDEQIDAAIKNSKKVDTGYAGWVRDQRREFGRAIEAAHGIRPTDFKE